MHSSTSGRSFVESEPLHPGGRHLGAGATGRRHLDPGVIAGSLGAAVQWPGSSSVRHRSWRLIAQTGDFDAWLIAWPGGAAADLHDHGGSRGAIHVIDGTLTETIPWPDDRGSVAFARREVHSGATVAFGAGHVHDVRNESAGHALSLHVYSPPLRAMNYYDRSGDVLVRRAAVWTPSREHPSPNDRPFSRLLAT